MSFSALSCVFYRLMEPLVYPLSLCAEFEQKCFTSQGIVDSV